MPQALFLHRLWKNGWSRLERHEPRVSQANILARLKHEFQRVPYKYLIYLCYDVPPTTVHMGLDLINSTLQSSKTQERDVDSVSDSKVIINLNMVERKMDYKAFAISRCIGNTMPAFHDDVIKWKHFLCYRHFVRGIHWSPVDFPHKSLWCGALSLSSIRLDKRLSNQSRHHWLETPSQSL